MKFVAVAMMLIVACVAFEATYEQTQSNNIRSSATNLIGQSGGCCTGSTLPFATTFTNTTHLSINAVGNVNIGVSSGPPTVYSFVPGSTETVTAVSGTGLMYEYIDVNGLLDVGSIATLTCTGVCNFVSGISAFPVGSTPLYKWPVVSGTFSAVPSPNTYDLRAPLSGNLGGSGGTGPGGGITCDSGVTSYTSFGAVTSQEITILSSLPGTYRYTNVVISETTQFSGGSGTSLTVSMGRPGSTTHAEMFVPMPLMVSGSDANFLADVPSPPLVVPATNAYGLVLNFIGDGTHLLNTYTAGSVTWEACHYVGATR